MAMPYFGEARPSAVEDEITEPLAACICLENCENGITEWRIFDDYTTCRDGNQIKIGNENKSLEADIFESYYEIGKEEKSLYKDNYGRYTALSAVEAGEAFAVVVAGGDSNQMKNEKSCEGDILQCYYEIGSEEKSLYKGSFGLFAAVSSIVDGGDRNQIKKGNGGNSLRAIESSGYCHDPTCGDSNPIEIISWDNNQIMKYIREKIAAVLPRWLSNLSKIGNGRANTAQSEGSFSRCDDASTSRDTNQIKNGIRDPIATLPLRMHVRWVVLGSIIYCIGIRNSQKSKSSRKRNCPRNYESGVYCFDILFPGKEWYPGPSMIAHRFFPYTLVVDGKLYVLGGVADIDFKVPWAEVFDPITGKWEAIPDPPPGIPESRLVCAASHDDGESKILVGTYDNNLICEYNAANKCWQLLPGHNMKFDYSGPAVAVHGKVFWFTETGHLSAYDLRHKLLYKGRVDERLKDIGPNATLVHLGGYKFCLFWISGPTEPKSGSDSDHELESGSGRGSRFHCFKFEVSMGIKNGKGWLKACKQTCQTFFIDADVRFMDAMLM